MEKKDIEIQNLKKECENLLHEIEVLKAKRMVHMRSLEGGMVHDLKVAEEEISEMAVKINAEEIRFAGLMRKLSDLSDGEVYPDFGQSSLKEKDYMQSRASFPSVDELRSAAKDNINEAIRFNRDYDEDTSNLESLLGEVENGDYDNDPHQLWTFGAATPTELSEFGRRGRVI